ncbi:hypothetical protein [Neobacillus dielmonensis]|uniref:hypothetical protein n=1 Tax=Neobacillus dielmonensis TaxID=1347369 RepID=UPI0012B58A4A|nr:hypothetical protein [Neobacillus dielmonensis]
MLSHFLLAWADPRKKFSVLRENGLGRDPAGAVLDEEVPRQGRGNALATGAEINSQI